MTSQPPFDPSPRPALRRASDSGVHPTAPANIGVGGLQQGATADAITGPRKDKLVKLKVEVPKSLKASLADEAKRRGMSLDQLVALILRSR